MPHSIPNSRRKVTIFRRRLYSDGNVTYTFDADTANATDYELSFDWFPSMGYHDSTCSLQLLSDDTALFTIKDPNAKNCKNTTAYVYGNPETESLGSFAASGRGSDPTTSDAWVHIKVVGHTGSGVTLTVTDKDGDHTFENVSAFAKITGLKIRLETSAYTVNGGVDNLTVKIPIPATTYTWVGDATGDWDTLTNWKLNGKTPEALPTADSKVYIGKTATINGTDASYSGDLILNADVTLTGTNRFSNVRGTGKLIASSLTSKKAGCTINTPLVVDGYFYNNSNGGIVTINGPLSGTGSIYTDNANQPACYLNGDASEFAGTYKGGWRDDGDRDNTRFRGVCYGSKLAQWTVGRYAQQVFDNNTTYQFGTFTSPTEHYKGSGAYDSRSMDISGTSGSTLEMGYIEEGESTFKGVLGNNTIRKVGDTSTLALMLKSNAGTLAIDAGTVTITAPSRETNPAMAPAAISMTGATATLVAPTSLTLPTITTGENMLIDYDYDEEKQTTTYTVVTAPEAPAADIMAKTAVSGTARVYTFNTTEQLYTFDGEYYHEMVGNTLTVDESGTVQVAAGRSNKAGETLYSEVSEFTVTAGSAVTLATPKVYRAGFTAVAVNASQSSIECTPTPTIVYTIGGGAEQTVAAESASGQVHFTIPDVKGTVVTVKATAAGYTDSETVTYTVGGVDLTTHKIVPNYTVDYVGIRALGLSSGNPTYGSQLEGYKRDVRTLNWGTTNISNGVIYYGYESTQRWRLGTYMSVETFYKYNTTNALVITGLKAGQVVEFIANNIYALKDNLTVADINDSDHWDRFYTVGADGNALIEMGPAGTGSSKTDHYMFGLRVYEASSTDPAEEVIEEQVDTTGATTEEVAAAKTVIETVGADAMSEYLTTVYGDTKVSAATIVAAAKTVATSVKYELPLMSAETPTVEIEESATADSFSFEIKDGDTAVNLPQAEAKVLKMIEFTSDLGNTAFADATATDVGVTVSGTKATATFKKATAAGFMKVNLK